MSWKNLRQDIFISIWRKCDSHTQKSLSRVCEAWFSFVSEELRLSTGVFAKWNTSYLPEYGFSPHLIESDYTLVGVYFYLCHLHDKICYLMDKVINTGHGLESLFKIVGTGRLDYTLAILFRFQNHFSPSMGKLFGSDLEGKIVYFEDDYYAHLKSRLSCIGRSYIASLLLQGLRYKRLYEALLEIKESEDPIDIDTVVLRLSLLDDDYFQLMVCRRRVLDRVAKKYASSVTASMPIETRILNVSSYLQNFSAQESSVVGGVVDLTPKRGLLSRYYGGDIATPPLFIFACALSEALKACGFKCYIIEFEKLLICHRGKFYSCTVGEEFVVRELSQDDGKILRSVNIFQKDRCDPDDYHEGISQHALERFGFKTCSEVLTMVHNAMCSILRNNHYSWKPPDVPDTETKSIESRKILFLPIQPNSAYNICARSTIGCNDFRGPLIFMEHILSQLSHERDFYYADRRIALDQFTPVSAKALIVRGNIRGLRFLKGQFQLGLPMPYSKLLLPCRLDDLEFECETDLSIFRDGTVFDSGDILLHASCGRRALILKNRGGWYSRRYVATADIKQLLSIAESDKIGAFFSHFDWEEERWILNKLCEISCEEFDKRFSDPLDDSPSQSDGEDWEAIRGLLIMHDRFLEPTPVLCCSYGISSKRD